MPDLLAHALIGYAVCLIASWRYNWLSQEYVTVGMAGVFIPDLAKADLLLGDGMIEQFLGIPFDWFALHTMGGVLVSILIGTVLVVAQERVRVAAVLALGAGTHLVADALLRTPTGRSYSIMWPLTRYKPPTPGWYLSTEPTPMVIALLVAIAVTLLSKRRRSSSTS